MAVNVGDLVATLRVESAQFEQGVKRAGGSLQALSATARTASQSFLTIQRDVQMAARDFRAGKISVDDYRTALSFASAEARALAASGIKPTGAELRAFRSVLRATGEQAKQAVPGMRTLRGAMGTLAFTAAGLPGNLGRVSAMIANLSMGALTTAGVFAGMAAIAFAFRKIGEESREAKKRIDDFIRSSASFRRAQQEQTLGEAQAEQQRIIGVLERGGRERAGFDPLTGERAFEPISDKQREALTERLAGLTRAIRETTERLVADEVEAIEAGLQSLRMPAFDAAGGIDLGGLNEAMRRLVSGGVRSGGDVPQPSVLADARTNAVARIEDILGSVRTREPEQALDALAAMRRELTAAGMEFKDLTPGLQRLAKQVEETAGAMPGAALGGGGGGLGDMLGGTFKRILDPKQIVNTAIGGLLSGGISTLMGAVTSGIVGLFRGPQNLEAARQSEMLRQSMERNREALERVSDGLLRLATSTVTLPFEEVATAIEEALRIAEETRGQIGQGGEDESVTAMEALAEALRRMGLTMEDVRRVAEAMGLEFVNTEGFLTILQRALGDVNTFARDFGLLRTTFQLFDVNEPAARFRRIVELLADNVGPGLADTLRNLTPETFDAFLERFREGFGALGPEDLGNLALEDFIQALLDAESALDEMQDTVSQATEALRNAPAGFKLAAARFAAITPEPTGGSPSGASLRASAGLAAARSDIPGAGALHPGGLPSRGVVMTGPVTIVANDPRELYERTMTEARRQARRGGTAPGDVAAPTVRVNRW